VTTPSHPSGTHLATTSSPDTVHRVTTESSTSTAAGVLPVEQYVAGLARKRMAAGVLFRDNAGRVLLVEPSYKPNWEIPGGAVEADESPWAAATREPAEELGWNHPLGRLLVVDYVRPQDSRPEGIVFVFDGGVLNDNDLVGMVFPDAEVVSAAFHTIDETKLKVKPILANRLAAALYRWSRARRRCASRASASPDVGHQPTAEEATLTSGFWLWLKGLTVRCAH
jgi:8-oxo-dGTP pyrophosphatase MutT (NUDIX family)